MSMNGSAARLWALSLLAAAVISVAGAGEPPADPPVDPRVDLAKKIPGAKAEELKPTSVPGIYELTRGTDVGYVTSDGRFYFAGDMYDIQQSVNLTDASRNGARRSLLATIPDSETITFSPANPKYTITVFTDVDCGYCRKLHSEVKELNKLGIRVRYVSYPREGPGSEAWEMAEAVWCSPDRGDALTRAKLGEEIKAPKCGATPVARQYELGHKLNIHGTPGIFTAEGEYITGYLPPKRLLEQVKHSQAN
jgi:thiol:disulfide interchange protein DsbC